MQWPNKVLMVKPNGFQVKYAINPHMLDQSGNLKKVDSSRAMQQWEQLKKQFINLGLSVSIIEGDPDFPDMVFCANQTFPFFKGDRRSLILSNMNSSERRGEIVAFAGWAEKNNIDVYRLKTSASFEGCGDAIWNYETNEIFGGYGFRTEKSVYDDLEKIVESSVIRLRLTDPQFYHLDTCFAIGDKNTAFAVKKAFSTESWSRLSAKFTHLIEIPTEEAINNFAGNMIVLGGKNIIIHQGATQTCRMSRELNFNIFEIDTSEFMKSGGSAFCMKQLYF